MFASFYQGQYLGKTTPASREELWKLLVRITMCKVVNTAHRHLADRRDIRRERSERPCDSENSGFAQWMRDHVDRAQPTPEDRVAVVEEVERLLHLLPDELRQIVLWKLEGFTNAEISPMIGKTVRSVELKLQLIRRILEKEFVHTNQGRRSSAGGPAAGGSQPSSDS